MGKYTEKQIKSIIDTIIIKVDTREKAKHITDDFIRHGVSWEYSTVKSGDYTCYVPANEEIGLAEIDLSEVLVIERKNSLDEISQNLTKHKSRFNREFERSKAKITIMIEDNNYLDMATGNYRSQLHPKSFLGLLHSHCARYNSNFIFVPREVAALFIYNYFKYFIKEQLKSIE